LCGEEHSGDDVEPHVDVEGGVHGSDGGQVLLWCGWLPCKKAVSRCALSIWRGIWQQKNFNDNGVGPPNISIEVLLTDEVVRGE